VKNNKSLLGLSLLSMLIVGCTNAPNLSSFPSSSITSFNSSSTAISNLSTTSSSLISSSSSSSSNTQPNGRRVLFDQIGSLVAQVVDAKALAVNNSKDSSPTQNTRKNTQQSLDVEDQNKIVKQIEIYNPITSVNEINTMEVKFTKTIASTEPQTGKESYHATAEKTIIVTLINQPGYVLIENQIGYEFRLISGDIVLQDWISSETNTIEFNFNNSFTETTIQSRSKNASISFTAFEGFTYQIQFDEKVLLEELVDNDNNDSNFKKGVITLFGLTEVLLYDVIYDGYLILEEISQEEVDGQVDKLFVLNQYTFISFVPLNQNPRPSNYELILDYDGVATYDKVNYFSSSTRQSFVIDNNSGFIYNIQNTTITNLSGGCITMSNSSFPYDLRIDDNDNLQFYTIFTNNTVKNYGCFKDKYGHKYINNNKFNFYDQETNTYYYVFSDSRYNEETIANQGKTNFLLTDKNEAIKIEYLLGLSETSSSNRILSIKRIDLNNEHKDLNLEDSFKVYYKIQSASGNYLNSPYNGLWTIHEVKNGIAFGFRNTIVENFFNYSVQINFFDGPNSSTFSYTNHANDPYRFLTDYLPDYDILVFRNRRRQVLYTKNFMSSIYSYFIENKEPNFDNFDGNPQFWIDTTSLYTTVQTDDLDYSDLFPHNTTKLLDDTIISNGKVEAQTLQGNTKYDFIPEYVNDEWIIKPYVSGTYVAPPPTIVTFQPINK
jgi:hypothetical protein